MKSDDDDGGDYRQSDQQKHHEPKSRGGRTRQHPRSLANLKSWKPGKSGNPNGVSKSTAEVMRLARDEGEASIRKLAEIRDNPKAPFKVQVDASVALLDRGFGKPAAAVFHAGSLTGLEIEPEQAEAVSALLARAKLVKGIQ